MSDPLDKKLDALLASRPLQPSEDFAARVLKQADAADIPKPRSLGKLLGFALPIAAAVLLGLTLLQLNTGTPPPEATSSELTTSEAHEIFLLEESLTDLAALETADFQSQNMLATLDALELEI